MMMIEVLGCLRRWFVRVSLHLVLVARGCVRSRTDFYVSSTNVEDSNHGAPPRPPVALRYEAERAARTGFVSSTMHDIDFQKALISLQHYLLQSVGPRMVRPPGHAIHRGSCF